MQDYYPSATGSYAVFNIAANTVLPYSWRGNDVYDPDYSSGSVSDASIFWDQDLHSNSNNSVSTEAR